MEKGFINKVRFLGGFSSDYFECEVSSSDFKIAIAEAKEKYFKFYSDKTNKLKALLKKYDVKDYILEKDGYFMITLHFQGFMLSLHSCHTCYNLEQIENWIIDQNMRGLKISLHYLIKKYKKINIEFKDNDFCILDCYNSDDDAQDCIFGWRTLDKSCIRDVEQYLKKRNIPKKKKYPKIDKYFALY